MSETQAASDSKPAKKRTILTYVKYVGGVLLLLVLALVSPVVSDLLESRVESLEEVLLL